MSVAELWPASPASTIPSADELVARARALAPKLRERAVKAERDRNIPQESVDEYIAAGLVHTLQPKRWGGYEHDHEVAFDIAIELGKFDPGSIHHARYERQQCFCVTPANGKRLAGGDAGRSGVEHGSRAGVKRSINREHAHRLRARVTPSA